MKTLSNTLVQLVDILNDGHYHDGTTLGEQLNITRSAVWKLVQKLCDYGIPIDSIKRKGYKLLDPLILLNAAQIKKQLENKNIHLEVHESLASTNAYLKNAISHGNSKNNLTKKMSHICIAEYQTAGIGRFNREWHSPFGQNVYLSYAHHFNKDVSELAGLSLVVSMAMLRTLNNLGVGKDITIKWPNDLFYQQQKLAGNLVEVQAESNNQCRVIIGIGFNVNMLCATQKAITKKWTSLREISGQYINRNIFCAQLINQLREFLHKFGETGLQAFISEWTACDYLLGQTITIKTHDKSIRGLASGIDKYGRLLLQMTDGSVSAYSSGDTSIELT